MDGLSWLPAPHAPKPGLNMTKRQESKYKINRRLGENLWGRAKTPVNKREYPPGQHGQTRKKPTDYGTHLMARQRLQGYYGYITEKQFRRAYGQANRRDRKRTRMNS